MSKHIVKQGLIHVYTGDGKGKTTAALGVAFRALGWGARVCMVQFIKGYAEIGEAKIAAELGDRFQLRQFALDMSRGIGEKKVAERRESAEAAMQYAESAVASGFDLVILDEINNAMHYGLVDISRVLQMISNKPADVELILTGRNAPQEIIDAADYVTEMKLIKHPYQKGIPARPMFDY